MRSRNEPQKRKQKETFVQKFAPEVKSGKREKRKRDGFDLLFCFFFFFFILKVFFMSN